MIDLSLMKGVRVDPARRTVRVGPGCTQGDVDHATHAFGLAVPAGIVSTTGIAGLTLGGGTGYLTRKYGLTIDNLLEADVVLADGSFVTASKSENPDLFWALRGGGGNFGVVTSFLFQAHPVEHGLCRPDLLGSRRMRATVMQRYREFLPSAPEELGAFVGLKTVPSMDPFPAEHLGQARLRAHRPATTAGGGGRGGHGAVARWAAAAALQLDGRNALSRRCRRMFDPFFPKGLQWYWRGDFVKELTDEAIDAHIAQAAKAAERAFAHASLSDRRRGASRRQGAIPPGTPATRPGRWSSPASIPIRKRRARSRAGPRATGRRCIRTRLTARYVNFMMDDEGDSAAQGDLWRQLRPPRRLEGEIRPDEPLPRQPEHQTAALVDDQVCRTVQSRPNGLVGAFLRFMERRNA